MNVYIFQAALLCEDCGAARRKKINASGNGPASPDDESSYDSDDHPKGPYPDGGGESDTPSHCDSCRAFLENPLTGDGVKYVAEAIREDKEGGRDRSHNDVVALWRDFYAWELSDYWRKHSPKFYECDSCNEYHPSGFDGDCRDDANRYTRERLESEFGDEGEDWIETIA